jgi:hypothetical protein
MEAVHGFRAWVLPSGIVVTELCVALRGKCVDRVEAPQ